MRTVKIHKYPIVPVEGQKPTDPLVVKMPKEAELLDASFVGEDCFIWAEHRVYHEGKTEERKFYVIPTGSEIVLSPSAKYFRTVLSPKMGLVFHIYVDAWDYRPPYAAVMD